MRYILLLFVLLAGCAHLGTNGTFNRDGCAGHWPAEQFPLQVVVDSGFSPEMELLVQETVMIWNTEIGENAFTIVRSLPRTDYEWWSRRPGHVYVTSADLPDEDPLTTYGLTSFNWRGCTITDAVIFFDDALTEDFARPVALHEFGHALGLAHDVNWRPSIMFPDAVQSGNKILGDDLAFIRWQMTSEE